MAAVSKADAHIEPGTICFRILGDFGVVFVGIRISRLPTLQ